MHLLSWGSYVLAIWPTPQAELLHPDIYKHRVSMLGCWAGGCGPRGDDTPLPPLGEVVSNWGGGSAGGDGPDIRNWVLNSRRIMGEARRSSWL